MLTRLDAEQLEVAIKAELTEKCVPGAALAIVRPDAPPYVGAFGVTYLHDGTAITDETLFRLGSNSKVLIAAVILQLAVEKRLELHVPVSQYLNLPTRLGRITLHQLLSHTSGLKDSEEVNLIGNKAELAEPVSAWTDRYCFTEPGEIYSYSTLGFALALATASAATQLPAQELLAQKLFHPLGMTATTLLPSWVNAAQLSVGHYLDDDGELRNYPSLGDVEGVWPASAMVSNARDLACFLAALLNDGA
ncbi:MAG: serine hydrolase, partial [Acidobacteria bacterium]|nr:serine hydrolase [Acidobacteriota bacterium]